MMMPFRSDPYFLGLFVWQMPSSAPMCSARIVARLTDHAAGTHDGVLHAARRLVAQLFQFALLPNHDEETTADGHGEEPKATTG